ncbi:hypothetical protein VNO77_31642 [Canavalia gladiata]|uniref:Uncharacterized protein n=1 Tax=Canavalia gladiata TaxID=3824 RepID=A0AAN9KS14_CANGL
MFLRLAPGSLHYSKVRTDISPSKKSNGQRQVARMCLVTLKQGMDILCLLPSLYFPFMPNPHRIESNDTMSKTGEFSRRSGKADRRNSGRSESAPEDPEIKEWQVWPKRGPIGQAAYGLIIEGWPLRRARRCRPCQEQRKGEWNKEDGDRVEGKEESSPSMTMMTTKVDIMMERIRCWRVTPAIVPSYKREEITMHGDSRCGRRKERPTMHTYARVWRFFVGS